MLFTLRTTRWALGFSLCLGLVLCVTPLVSGWGPESALVLALALSPWACALGARLACAARGRGVRTEALVGQAIFAGWLVVLGPVVLLALNALRVKSCDPWRGLSFLALGPWLGVSLAAVCGCTLGATIRSTRLATWCAALLPILAVVRPLYDFVSTPGIFAFGHFFGYFPGTFYDRRIDVPDAWLSHRLISGAIGFGLWAFLAATRQPRSGMVLVYGPRRNSLLGGLAVLSAVAALSAARRGEDLGHHTSSAFIAHRLGKVIQGPRCHVVVPRELDLVEGARIAEDCAFRVGQLEHSLGVKESKPITAYFFRSPQEKRALMGAMRVYIAKPWRREVYLQDQDFPHPVLAHELAHVVARNAARGFFGVPGKLGGLIPEPVLVEGMAVALEPVARDELTPHQWAKAAQEAKLAPSLSEMLGPRFFSHNQQLGYTLAGSFLRFVLDTRGAPALRKVYAEGDAAKALGEPLPKLEQAWRAYLAQVPLPATAPALAKQRFERAGVFSQVCPHAIDRLEGELSAALSAGDLPRAIEKCSEVLEIDPKNSGTRAVLAGTLARAGKMTEAADALDAMKESPTTPRPAVARAEVGIADAAFMAGDFARAERSYRILLGEPQGESELRQLDVKLLALQAGDPTRKLVGELLIGRVGTELDPRSAMFLIQELKQVRKDGLAPYLEARQLLSANRPDLALPLIRQARSAGLATPRLRLEALRLHGLSAFLAGAMDESQACYVELSEAPGASLSDKLDASDFLARLAFRRGLD
ncbi:MAG: tetratricopeptide repeat protein [Myxococcales bacterium]